MPPAVLLGEIRPDFSHLLKVSMETPKTLAAWPILRQELSILNLGAILSGEDVFLTVTEFLLKNFLVFLANGFRIGF